jgi:hypothetical protein
VLSRRRILRRNFFKKGRKFEKKNEKEEKKEFFKYTVVRSK